jgi:hypothetical protein
MSSSAGDAGSSSAEATNFEDYNQHHHIADMTKQV